MIPTGAFGNAVAGYIAKRMGLPIRIVVSNGPTDASHQFIRTGALTVRPVTRVSLSCACDIGVPYNLQRYLYYLCGENAAMLRAWMAGFNTLQLPSGLIGAVRRDFDSTSSCDEEIATTIRKYYARNGYVLDPHTAMGVHGALQVARVSPGPRTIVVLATAGPSKFPSLVEPIIGRPVDANEFIAPLFGAKDNAIQVDLAKHNVPSIIKAKLHFLYANMIKPQ